MSTSPRLPRRPAFFVALLALAASLTSLGNGFAMDDLPIIVNNPRVHSLAAPWAHLWQTYWPPERGPALYRPLTIQNFALEWAAGGGTPFVFHLTNVLLYLVAALAVYWLVRQMLTPVAAFIVAALFAVHPVHVEAIGNVVGQPEIIVAIVVAVAVGWYVRARRTGPLGFRDGALLTACYVIGLAAKEHAVVLPGLLVIAELLLVPDSTRFRTRLERLLPTFLALVAVLVAFWTVRTMVTGGMIGRDVHPAFRYGGTETRLLTALGVVPEWMRLLLVPFHLSADYNPQEIPVITSLGVRPLIGLALILGLLAAVGWGWRRRPVVAFGILWVGLTLFPVSNFLIPTGIFLAERTLFLPSIGAIIAVVGQIAPNLPELEAWRVGRFRPAPALLALVLLAGVMKSAIRQLAWRDNPTIFARTALDAPRSYRARAADAVMLLESGREEAGEEEYRHALTLYRDDPNMFADLGDWYLRKNRCADALPMYARVLELEPAHWAATSRTILCLTRVDRLEEARRMAVVAVRRGDEDAVGKLRYVDSLIARHTP